MNVMHKMKNIQNKIGLAQKRAQTLIKLILQTKHNLHLTAPWIYIVKKNDQVIYFGQTLNILIR